MGKRTQSNRRDLVNLAHKMKALSDLIATGDWEPHADIDHETNHVVIGVHHKYTELISEFVVGMETANYLFEQDQIMAETYSNLLTVQARTDRNITRLFYQLLSQLRNNIKSSSQK